MNLPSKVALIAIMGCLLVSAGAVGFALALDNDMKQTAYEIKLAQTSLAKANIDLTAMDNKMEIIKSNCKADSQDVGCVMVTGGAVLSDFAQANQHVVNALMSISKHLNK